MGVRVKSCNLCGVSGDANLLNCFLFDNLCLGSKLNRQIDKDEQFMEASMTCAFFRYTGLGKSGENWSSTTGSFPAWGWAGARLVIR